MERFYEYIEQALPDKKGEPLLYKFKKQALETMTARANELTARGLKDRDVISDLIISENQDIAKEYKTYARQKQQQQRRRRFIIGNVVGSLLYLVTLVVCYLGISFSTNAWGTTWVLIVDGALLWISYLLTLGISKTLDMKRIFQILTRVLLALDIVIISVAIFIFMMGVLHVPKSWVIVFGGLLAMFAADATFASATRQKLAIINWLIYIPAMGAMVFIIIGALSIVRWSIAWLALPVAFLIDLILIIVATTINSKYDAEVVDTWKEN